MANLNYAEQYSRELAQAYPNVLNFGRLWSTENSTKYKVIDAKTIKIPTISTKGRVAGNRDSIGTFTRNFDNSWETKTLSNHRQWQTLVHPQDVDQTNMVTSIANVTKVMNEEQKFPEMDAYLISTLYSLKNAKETINQETVDLTVENVLAKFDALMDKMDEARVPQAGRILYCDTFTKTLVDNAIALSRTSGTAVIQRAVTRLEEVDVISVPSYLMKTAYTFTEGYVAAGGAKNIAMLLVHPSAVLPVVSYEFAQMQEPSAMSQGKYVYFEESFEDVFILDKKHDAIQFVVKKDQA